MPQTLIEPGLTTGHAPFVEEARDRGELYISQAYDLYTQENHEAWRRLYQRIRPRWERYANDHFLQRHRGPRPARTTAFPASPRSTAGSSR